MSVPVDEAAGNDPASFPALRGTAPATLAARTLARLADAATVFCWWMLATSGTPGAVAAGLVFVLATVLMLSRAQTPGEALLGLAALDVQTGNPAPGAAFVKVLLQLGLILGTLGLGLLPILATTRGPLRRNLADRATGVVLVSLRSDAEAVESEPTGWVSAVRRARWEGPEHEPSADAPGQEVFALLQVTGVGVKVQAGSEPVVIASAEGVETTLTAGDRALAGPGAEIRCAGVRLLVAGSRPSLRAVP